jgi:prepilin-type N-terminal cleavage/methylation domain-containing protein
VRRCRAGVTLIEVLIAVGLLSVLSLGILFALRIGLSALEKANHRLMDNRRIAGAQRILEQQLAGFMPVVAMVAPSPDAPGVKIPFFEGRAQAMRFVSSYSLGEASRGLPQVLEFQVIPGEEGQGVRLVVNENPYTGPRSAGVFSLGTGPDPELGVVTQRFLPVVVGPRSFVLADRLAYCRFSYLGLLPGRPVERWQPGWIPVNQWPLGIRIEMASLDKDPTSLKPLTVTAPIHVDRYPIFDYADELEE